MELGETQPVKQAEHTAAAAAHKLCAGACTTEASKGTAPIRNTMAICSNGETEGHKAVGCRWWPNKTHTGHSSSIIHCFDWTLGWRIGLVMVPWHLPTQPLHHPNADTTTSLQIVLICMGYFAGGVYPGNCGCQGSGRSGDMYKL